MPEASRGRNPEASDGGFTAAEATRLPRLAAFPEEVARECLDPSAQAMSRPHQACEKLISQRGPASIPPRGGIDSPRQQGVCSFW
jgi:hypothetical protein